MNDLNHHYTVKISRSQLKTPFVQTRTNWSLGHKVLGLLNIVSERICKLVSAMLHLSKTKL